MRLHLLEREVARDTMWTLFLMQELSCNRADPKINVRQHIDVFYRRRISFDWSRVLISCTHTATAALIKRLNQNSGPGDTYS